MNKIESEEQKKDFSEKELFSEVHGLNKGSLNPD